MEAELEADRAALTALVTAIETLAPPSAEALTPVLGEVAARLAIAAAGTAMIDADLLAARAHACGALLADELPPTRLCFHPDDFAALDIDALSYPAVSAADVERGSVRAEAGAAWAADGVREAIARIVAEVGL